MIRALKQSFSSLSMVVSEVQGDLAQILVGDLLDGVFVDHSKQRRQSASYAKHAALEQGISTFIDIKGRGKSGLYVPWHGGIEMYMPSRKDAREYWLAKLLHPLSKSMPPLDDSGHMVESYLGIAKFFGAKDLPVCFDIPFSSGTIEQATAVVKREGLAGQKSVALNIGSAQYSKIWPAANYRKLAELLEGDMKCKVVIMGSKHFPKNDDYDLSASREHFSDDRFTNLVEETTIDVDSHLLRSGAFNVCVGNDSFAGHMAGSVNEVSADTEGSVAADNGKHYKGNRTVSLFGPTNPRYCRPYDPTGKFNLIVSPAEYPSDCPYNREDHVCEHYHDKHCVGGNHCMKQITVEQVAEAVEKQLQTT
jgi:ADP-heptose:LPS heptosyltransferase